jgi:LPS-assembly protein
MGFLILVMRKIGVWLISAWCSSPLSAQEPQVLPGPEPAPAVDMISPVPAPEIAAGTLAAVTPVMPKNLKIQNESGSIAYDSLAGTCRFGGPVRIDGDNGLQIFSDTAVLDTHEKKITLVGNVSIYQGNLLQRGATAVYFYERKFLDASSLRASLDPLLLEAGKFTGEQRGGKQVFVGENSGLSTHDVETPGYWVRAKKTTIYPGEKVVFNNLKLYAGGIPVFWLPYFSQPLDAELGYHFSPGLRSNWGAFLLNSYGIMLGGNFNPKTGENEDAWLLSRWHVDLRSKRGVGVGVDLVDTRQGRNNEISGLSLYYLNDLAPNTRRAGIPREPVGEDRFQLSLKNRLPLDFERDAEWRLDTNLTLLSDQSYLEDFDTDTYRNNPVPENTIGLYRRDDNSLLSMYVRLRLNEFYRTDTRLPEISFDQARAPLFGSLLLHEGNTSLGIIGEQVADPTRKNFLEPLLSLTATNPAAQPLLNQLNGYDRQLAEKLLALPLGDPKRQLLRSQLLDSNYARFNTYQELSLPLTIADFIHLTPQAGIGYTRYEAIAGPLDGFDRTLLHAGAEASVKFSKNLSDFKNSNWGIDGLQHVFQPYSTWSVISTNDFDPLGPQVDRLSASTRPRPLDPTRFTAVDELQSWNVVRLGARNRLLTKRDKQSFEWLYMDTYIDAFINDPEGNRNFSNLYNDLRWQPVPWLSANLQTQFPIIDRGSGFNEVSTQLNFIPNDSVDFSIGYRVLKNHPTLLDSNLLDLRFYSRIGENWGFSSQHSLELEDGTLQFESYSLHRDLGSWTASAGIIHRDNRLKDEFGVIFSLTLKDFPSATLPFRLDAR